MRLVHLLLVLIVEKLLGYRLLISTLVLLRWHAIELVGFYLFTTLNCGLIPVFSTITYHDIVQFSVLHES
jgi:hypothetical protein